MIPDWELNPASFGAAKCLVSFLGDPKENEFKCSKNEIDLTHGVVFHFFFKYFGRAL